MSDVQIKQRSRMHRSGKPKPIVMTGWRVGALEILYKHRLADSDVFMASLEGNEQYIRKGLRDLWDNRFVDRPLEQWIMHKKHNGGKGRSEIVYALTNKGMQYLEQNLGYDRPKTDFDKKNRELGETTIFHDAALTKLWACLKVALDNKRKETKENYNLVFWYQDRPDRDNLKTEIILRNGEPINVIPDVAFKMQVPVSQYLFFVEYYRTRKGGHQIFLNKLKLYNLYFQQQKFTKYGVKKGFRVLTIVPSRTIAENLIGRINSEEQNAELRSIRFWFAAEKDYRVYHKEKIGQNTYKKILEVESILKPIFRVPVDEKWHSLEE